MEGGDVFLSINRFERKKGVALAIRSLQEVIARHAYSSGTCARCRLIVCGGFDPRCRENVQHFQELKELAEDLEVDARVVFLKNVTDQQRCASHAKCVRKRISGGTVSVGIVIMCYCEERHRPAAVRIACELS